MAVSQGFSTCVMVSPTFTSEVAHVAGGQHILGHTVHLQDTDFVGVIFVFGGEKLHQVVGANGAVEDTEIGDDAAEGVEDGVEDERLQRGLGVAFRRGDSLDDGLQDLLHALSRLAARLDDVIDITTEHVHNLILDLLGHGGGHVHLVDDRDDFQIIVNGLV